MYTAKDCILEIVNDQPDDSSYEEILHALEFDRMIRRGLDDADNGRFVSDEKIRQKIEQWSK